MTLKCYLYAEDSQIYIPSLNISPEQAEPVYPTTQYFYLDV